jgi:retron-type reverse transcriptase
MYETLMEEAVTDEKCRQALRAVKRNHGAPGIDRMSAVQLEPHLEANWQILKDKLLKGTYIPTPVKRVEIPKPSGGTRTLGIPTVQDRFIQQLLLQVLTPIFDPSFSEHSYGFRFPVYRLELASQALARTQRTKRGASRTEVSAAREGLGGGF